MRNSILYIKWRRFCVLCEKLNRDFPVLFPFSAASISSSRVPPATLNISVPFADDEDCAEDPIVSLEQIQANDKDKEDVASLYGTPKEELPMAGQTPYGRGRRSGSRSDCQSTSSFGGGSRLGSMSSMCTSAAISAAKPGWVRNQLQNIFQPTDNKLAMKLFGSKKALIQERVRQKAAGHWIIHPCSSFRFYWDLCMLLLLVANLIILPVAISFFNDDLSTRWIAFNCLSDTIFLIDIVVNFRTGKILFSRHRLIGPNA